MTKISIIVPVYNAERFLKRCLNSLITQTYENIEILCIDDGSSDISYSILLDYEKQDNRIRVFKQENKGQDAARNVGLQNAKGDFVMFCDADDYYEPTMCEEMITCMQKENVDLAVCDVFILEGDKDHKRFQKGIDEIYIKDFGKYDLTQENIPFILGTLWNKIFKMSLVKQFDVTFINEKIYCGDTTFVYKYILASRNVFFIKKKLYNYMLYRDSICGSLNRHDAIFDVLSAYSDIFEFSYKNKLLNSKWLCEDLENKFITNKRDSKSINSLCQKFVDFIPDEYFEGMPLFSKLVKRTIRPAFETNPSCFIFSTNDNYVPYLDVALISLIENSDTTKKYDICILYNELSKKSRQRLSLLQRENVSIRFVCITSFLSELTENIFFTCAHFSIETYFRFFIPSIFSQYQKICYLDCDMIFLKDMANIFDIELGDYSLAAVLDYMVKFLQILNPNFREYLTKKLKMLPDNYFNAGLLLLNIPKLLKNDFLGSCLKRMQEIKKPQLVDQDILNSLFSNKFKELPIKWNLLLNVEKNELRKRCSYAEFQEYEKATLDPYVLHYCSPLKPWNSNSDGQFNSIWWEYARKSSYYEEILVKFINQTVKH